MAIVHRHEASANCNEKCMLVSGKKREPVLAAFVARAFAQELYEELGNATMIEVIELNRRETNKGVCHSHDFCDANMTMARAMERCGINPEVENEDVVRLWNAAWELAVKDEFRSGKPH